MIPTYRSQKWIKENWRVLFIKKNKLVIGDQCSAKNHLSEDGKERLCLPLAVINRMIKTTEKKNILKNMIRRKSKAKEKIPLHPEINRYIGLFYKGVFKPKYKKTIIVKVKNNKLQKCSSGVKLDQELYKTICSDFSLKKKFIKYCKQKQIQKTY
tara:strand:+ start:870 stop:1334 length:465 start_codon:yes stop_codon:yes gene_type:complete